MNERPGKREQDQQADISLDHLANLARNAGMARKSNYDPSNRSEEYDSDETALSPLIIKINRIINALKI